jgi:hypothetical protein
LLTAARTHPIASKSETVLYLSKILELPNKPFLFKTGYNYNLIQLVFVNIKKGDAAHDA